MRNLSPELALVDGELARAARASLPHPGDLARSRARPSSAAQPHAPRRVLSRSTLVVAGAVLAAAAATLVPAAMSGGSEQAEVVAAVTEAATAPARSVQPPAVAASTPAPAPTRRRDVRIAWRGVPKAVVYNVILMRNGKRVDFWPAENRLILGKGSAARPKLAPGRYSWFVYPGVKTGSEIRYGDVIADGVVRVPRP